MIAAQVDTVLIGSTVYARIVSPTNPLQVWDTNAEEFANRGDVTAANMAVSGTVDTTGFFTASEPTGFPAGLIADCTLHEQVGGSAAADDPYAGSALTNMASVATLTTTEQARLDASVGSRLASAGYTAPPTPTQIAVEVESHLVDDGDATALLEAIANKLATDFDLGELSVATIAAAVWNMLLTSISLDDSIGKLLKDRIDASVSSRATNAGVWIENDRTLTNDDDIGAAAAAAIERDGGMLDATKQTVEVAKAVTDKLDTLLQPKGEGVQFTAEALEEAPVGEGGEGGGLTPEQAGQLTNIEQTVEGLELSAGEPVQVNNTKVVESRVFRLSTRRDGRYWASGPYRPVPGEALPIWIDTSRYAGDANLANVTGVSSSDEDVTTFAAAGGVKDQYVVLHPQTDLGAVDGDRCELLFTFHPMGSDQGVPGALEVVVMGASEGEGS